MKTYKLKVKQTFTGTIEVRAESKEDALRIVNTGFNMPSLDVHHRHTWESHSKDSDGITDYEFATHAQETRIS